MSKFLSFLGGGLRFFMFSRGVFYAILSFCVAFFRYFVILRTAFFVISSFFVALFRLHSSSFCVALFHGDRTKWQKPDTIDSSL